DSAGVRVTLLTPCEHLSETNRADQARVAVVEGTGEDLQSHRLVWRGHSCRADVNYQFRQDRGTYAAPLCASFSQFSTSSACPSGFTFLKMCLILPSGPMMNVVRATPITFLPYMFFS